MKWTAQDAKDAQRLLQRLDERSRRKALAGGGWEPAKIAESQAHVPARELGEKADDEESTGSGMLDPRRQQLTSAQGEVGRGFDCGQVVVGHGKCWPAEGMAGGSITCPRPDADMIANGFTVLVSNSNAHRK